jgi:hypothetical protein
MRFALHASQSGVCFGMSSYGAARLVGDHYGTAWLLVDELKQADLLFGRISAHGIVDASKIRIIVLPDLGSPNASILRLAGFGRMITGMTYLERSSVEQIDNVRLTGFQRAATRPSGKLRRPTPDSKKAHQRASGRLRTAAYRINLDRNKKPESNVVGMALLAAVVTQTSLKAFDAASVSIVTAAFADLQERGYSRSEIEAVFRRFRKMLVARPNFVSNENG